MKIHFNWELTWESRPKEGGFLVERGSAVQWLKPWAQHEVRLDGGVPEVHLPVTGACDKQPSLF